MHTQYIQSTHLGQEVEGDPAKKDVSEVFDDTKRCVDHPVGQPLCVIILVLRINSLAAKQRKECVCVCVRER